MVTNDVTSSDDSGPYSLIEVVNSFPGTDVRISGVETTRAGAVRERKSGVD